MGGLGDVLEILCGPDDRFKTVEATIRWCIRTPHKPESAVGLATADPAKPPKVLSKTFSTWISWPHRARIEMRHEVDGVIITSLDVIDGPRRWERDAEGHVVVTDGEGKDVSSRLPGEFSSDIDRHFCPRQIRAFFSQTTLKSLGPVRVAGWNCERIRAIPRASGGMDWRRWFPFFPGVYEYDVDVDRERGAVLGFKSIHRGEVFASSEVVEVAFDVPLGDELFAYEPAPGEQVEPKAPIFETLSLAGAVARMPFTVLIPTRVPNTDRTICHLTYYPPRRGGGWSHLSLAYLRTEGAGRLRVDQGQRPAPGLEKYEWERVDVASDSLEGLRISDPRDNSGDRLVVFEQSGTHVRIRSNLDRERLIDLATSFVPASSRITPADSLIII